MFLDTTSSGWKTVSPPTSGGKETGNKMSSSPFHRWQGPPVSLLDLCGLFRLAVI